jgi:hypothetical protein
VWNCLLYLLGKTAWISFPHIYKGKFPLNIRDIKFVEIPYTYEELFPYSVYDVNSPWPKMPLTQWNGDLRIYFKKKFDRFLIFFALTVFRNCCVIRISVAEPHHFYAAPAPGKNFDAAPAPAAPAPTLLYSKTKILKQT